MTREGDGEAASELHLAKRLLLLGGGHTHALFIRRWAQEPLAHVAVTLIAPQRLTPYSGMLPGYIAGFYSHDEIHIDLLALCRVSGVRYLEAWVTRIDHERKLLIFADGAELPFDILSINVGSEATAVGEPRGISVRPMASFLPRLPEILAGGSLAIIGGGAGGVELALSLKTRQGRALRVALIQREADLMPNAPGRLRQRLATLCREKNVLYYGGIKQPESLTRDYASILWATRARGPQFLEASDLPRDAAGFLMTDPRLLVRGCDAIFAAGDCAVIEGQPRPRAGVYAVRLADPLFANVKAALTGKTLKSVRLQKRHLALIMTGEKAAIALYGRFFWEHPLIWRLKDRIDRRFMGQFPRA